MGRAWPRGQGLAVVLVLTSIALASAGTINYDANIVRSG